MQTREWESNGQTNRHTEVVATRVQFLDSPADGVKGTDTTESELAESQAGF
jgi:single-stranded DNA-binding protein